MIWCDFNLRTVADSSSSCGPLPNAEQQAATNSRCQCTQPSSNSIWKAAFACYGGVFLTSGNPDWNWSHPQDPESVHSLKFSALVQRPVKDTNRRDFALQIVLQRLTRLVPHVPQSRKSFRCWNWFPGPDAWIRQDRGSVSTTPTLCRGYHCRLGYLLVAIRTGLEHGGVPLGT